MNRENQIIYDGLIGKKEKKKTNLLFSCIGLYELQ